MTMEAVRPGVFGNLPLKIDNPIGINPSLSANVQLLSNITTLIAILCLLLAVLSLILRLRLAQGDEAQQVKWFIFAAAFIPIGFLFQAIAYINPDWARPALTISYLLVTISLFGLPIASAIAIFKYHLYGIDTLINRTLVYGALSLILAMIYFGSVVLLQDLFESLTGKDQSQIVVVISTLSTAALFAPLRNRIHNDIDRRFYRRKYNAAETLEVFTASLRQEMNLDEISRAMLNAAIDTMQPENAWIWLSEPDRPKR